MTDVRPATEATTPGDAGGEHDTGHGGEQCDWCGSTDTWWRNCKLLCRSCGAIVKSCADL